MWGWAKSNTEKEKLGCWGLQDCLKKRKATEDANPLAADTARQAQEKLLTRGNFCP